MPASQRVSVEAEIQALGHPDFYFWEPGPAGAKNVAPESREYYPVLNIYPLASNRRALGLNLAADPDRLKALQRARKLKVMVATAPIELVQESGAQRTTILYLPVFFGRAESASSLTTEQFRGFVSGVLNVNGLLGNLLDEARKANFGINIEDVTDPDKPVTFVRANETAFAQLDAIQKTIAFGGRRLAITFFANDKFDIASKDWSSWIILTIGFLISAIMQAFILLITGYTENTKREVAHQTRALTLAKQQAEEANQAKSNFLANMSHELRTPLNAITGLVNLCLKTPLATVQKDYLQQAQLASEVLLSLINHTLDYAKIEAGKLELENTEFAIFDSLRKIHVIFSTQAEQQGIAFKLDIASGLPRILVGDALRLEQVLLNLCSNALKFTQEGQVELKLHIVSEHDQQIRLQCIVSDTGIGIPDEQLPFLFDSFRQADSSTTRKFGGSGLGLAITKRLVELMNGTINASSVERQGSQFTVTLPFGLPAQCEYLSAEEEARYFYHPSIDEVAATSDLPVDVGQADVKQESAEAGRLEGAEQEPDSGPLAEAKILVVEDVKVNQMIVRVLLEGMGAQVVCADNGREALDILERDCAFDVVLMDLQMPILDGYATTQFMRQDARVRHLPILAMTANAMVTDIEKCLAAGMNGHIAKPINEQDLLEKILTQLEG